MFIATVLVLYLSVTLAGKHVNRLDITVSMNAFSYSLFDELQL